MVKRKARGGGNKARGALKEEDARMGTNKEKKKHERDADEQVEMEEEGGENEVRGKQRE